MTRALFGLMMLSTASMRLRAAGEDVPIDSTVWWLYAGISTALVIFAGLMSGLTLGLMSLGVVDLEILERSGTPTEKKYAAVILPVVQRQHYLLVTLLLCNAGAMEALPIFLDKMFSPVTAVILSVTFVLIFGEVFPQAICARYGLSIGANLIWLVKILMILCFPVSFPLGKLLDALLGHHDTLFRRPQLKALVSIHAQDAGRGGELTRDEAMIISGALDLTAKTAEEAMTPIESAFSLEVNSKLDWEAMEKLRTRGHSRVPVYSENPHNVVGLLLLKSLLTVRPEAETPVSAVSIRKIPRVPADMPLYDILNEFQKGNSHMAAVVRAEGGRKQPGVTVVSFEDNTKSGRATKEESGKNAEIGADIVQQKPPDSREQRDEAGDELENGDVIGIITLEDVIEELLQEEIVDETDEYVDVHKRIRVAASLSRVASNVRRAGSFRVLGAKGSPQASGSPRKFLEGKLNDERSSGEGLTQPLLRNDNVASS